MMRSLWKRLLAYWRLDLNAICEMSRGRPEDADYHDYPDSDNGSKPWHFYTHRCARCGKEFII
jgi:hypothetical protein